MHLKWYSAKHPSNSHIKFEGNSSKHALVSSRFQNPGGQTDMKLQRYNIMDCIFYTRS